jgi:ATP-dependent helicase HepA
MAKYTIGQKWISETEPELGLGHIEKVEMRTIYLNFPRTQEKRAYRTDNPPIKRYHVQSGQKASFNGESHLVEAYREDQGLIYYGISSGEISEIDLDDAEGSVTDLWSKLLDLNLDDLESFELRQKARETLHQMQSSPVQGLLGARINLIPHQFFIAHNACAEARLPRRLLSDEVGLGKTIEAGLIYHKLKATGRIHRTLILIPEALKHQWMMEMYRRFHTVFTVIDDDFCDAFEDTNPDDNPFLSRNEVICDLDFILFNPKRMKQVLDAHWDLLILDEAHRIDPGEDNDSVDYMFLYKISQKTPGLLLLTATPIQLQLKAHFSRLHLLDPAKFSAFSKWKSEHENYQELAQHLGPVLEKSKKHGFNWDDFWQALPEESPAFKRAQAIPRDSMQVEDMMAYLYDTMGTGRSVVRNTRQAIGGFPIRKLHAYPLDAKTKYISELAKFEIDPEDSETHDFRCNKSMALGKDWFLPEQASTLPNLWAKDEKLLWLASLLNNKLKGKKTLVICSSRETTLSLQEQLQKLTPIDFVVFHEDIPVVARDRAAAWFADPTGAQVLIASEIGSEGRNFQFAHDMILYDLPKDAALLEQRIGRLDRIGQTQTVQIHIPYVLGSYQENLYEWYHQGLNAFIQPLMGVEKVHEEFYEELNTVLDCASGSIKFADDFLSKVSARALELKAEVELGRDKLLEYNSYNHQQAQKLISLIKTEEENSESESFVMETFEHYGVEIDNGPIPGSWIAKPGEHMKMDTFPGLPEEGLTFTSERSAAITRDDFQLFSMDHPINHTCLDLILGKDEGRVTFATCKKGLPKGLFLELDYQLEMDADPKWNLQAQLCPRPIKVLLDAKGKLQPKWAEELPFLLLKDGDEASLEKFIPYLMDHGHTLQGNGLKYAEKLAEQKLVNIRKECLRITDNEIRRLQGFAASGLAGLMVRLKQLAGYRKDVEKALSTPNLRLESIRVIHV